MHVHSHVNNAYRNAIIFALESQKDYRERSNIDIIRRHTQDILAEGNTWNDAVFLQTLKHIVRAGEIDLAPKSTVQPSPEFKKKRADSLIQKVSERLDAMAATTEDYPTAPRSPPKKKPVRRPEHDKFRIVPKKIYDHTM